MKTINLTVEHWAVVRPDLVVAGSTAQAHNVLEMALQDIATLAADRDRTERNRNMWKGQCERQAAKLTDIQAVMGALTRLRYWLATEGLSEQLEWADDALSKAGVDEVRCIDCDGDGEWDEGPLAATSRHQISPEYRHVVCPDCNGTGSTPLTAAKGAA